MLIILSFILVLRKCKNKNKNTYNVSTNVAYNKRSTVEDPTQSNDYETVTDNSATYDYATPNLYRGPERKTEHVHKSSSVISVSVNAAYAGVGRPNCEMEIDKFYDDIIIVKK